jgi:hypothetical protein
MVGTFKICVLCVLCVLAIVSTFSRGQLMALLLVNLEAIFYHSERSPFPSSLETPSSLLSMNNGTRLKEIAQHDGGPEGKCVHVLRHHRVHQPCALPLLLSPPLFSSPLNSPLLFSSLLFSSHLSSLRHLSLCTFLALSRKRGRVNRLHFTISL